MTTELAMALTESRLELQQPVMERIEEHAEWPLLSQLPVRLTASIPLRRFKVKDLLALSAGHTLVSDWLAHEEVPVKIGAVQLSWSEFEVMEQKMALRLTRLA